MEKDMEQHKEAGRQMGLYVQKYVLENKGYAYSIQDFTADSASYYLSILVAENPILLIYAKELVTMSRLCATLGYIAATKGFDFKPKPISEEEANQLVDTALEACQCSECKAERAAKHAKDN
jgi:hypothetical protein